MSETPTPPPLRLSVIIPTYNSGPWLAEAVRSVGDPPPPGVEVIVIDDGSTDGSAEALAGWPRITVLQQPNAGPAAARNRGLAAARGEFVAFLDADDRWLPGRTAALVAGPLPAADFLYEDYRIVDVATGAVGTMLCPALPAGAAAAPVLLRHNIISSSTVVAPRAALAAAGGFREDLRLGEDWDLWLRLAERGTVAKLPGVWTEHRERAGSLTAAAAGEIHRAGERVLAAALARRPELYRAVARRARADLECRSGMRAYRARDFLGARRHFLRAIAGGRWRPSASYFLRSLGAG
jgi:glycosyltransferase involved in cell wall biosynthesis